MPNRFLKESICISESIDSLTFFEECLFYRLIVNCDDFGRFEGRTAILKGRLFPLKGDVTFGMIEEGLRKLNSVGLVEMYECDGKPYLYIPTWEKHQTVRAATSKFPDPKDCESICIQLQTDENSCKQIHPYSYNDIRNSYSYNDIRNSVSDSVQAHDSENGTDEEQAPKSKRKPNKQIDERFEIFWSEYPRHEKKKEAIAAFKAIHVTDELLDTMLDALRRQKASEQWQNPKYIPMPTTWLHGRRWEDEAPKAPQKNRYSALEALMAQTIAEEGGNA